MKIINGKNTVLGRLATFVAKEALRGEEVSVVNCEEIIITGNKKNLREEFFEKRSKVGSSQKGPKVSRDIEKYVKRTIRGMLPNHREGRGKEALKKIKCYKGVPKELEEKEMIEIKSKPKYKYRKLKEIIKK